MRCVLGCKMHTFCISKRGWEWFNTKINHLYFDIPLFKAMVGKFFGRLQPQFFFFFNKTYQKYNRNHYSPSVCVFFFFFFFEKGCVRIYFDVKTIESQNKTYKKKLYESLIFNRISSLHNKWRACYVHYYLSTYIHFSTTPLTKKKYTCVQQSLIIWWAKPKPPFVEGSFFKPHGIT